MSKAADSAKKKRRKTISTVITLLLVVFALVGLGIMLYPSFSDWWNSMHASKSISEYVQAIEQFDILDPQNSYEIMSLLEEINRRGTTVVIVTHDREVVNRMQKRVVALQEGTIIEDKRGGYNNRG